MALTRLYTGRDALDAHHLRAHMESGGLRAVVLGETLGAARGDLPVTMETLPAVFVNSEDLDQARDLLESYLALDHLAETAEHPWICPACEKVMEGQFDVCWQCGEERPVED